MNTGHKKNRQSIIFRMLLLTLFLSFFTGINLNVKAEVNEGTRVLAFSSDVHNKSNNLSRNRLEGWIDLQLAAYGRIDYIGFCGDMGDASASESQFWEYSKRAIDLVKTTKNLDACFTTGNHEYNPANFNTTSDKTKDNYTVDAEAKTGDGYHIYCLGSAGSSEKYTGDQTTKLKAYFQSLNDANDYDPVIVLTHFPLHVYKGGNSSRIISNAEGVIDELNDGVTNGRKVILLWGHNHSRTPKDSHYDQIYAPGTSLNYASNQDKTIQFYYGAAGCMSDSEYTGSQYVLGKGLIILIDENNNLKFTYFNADRAEIAGFTETGFSGELDITISLNSSNLSLETGDIINLQATVTPQSAADQGVSWESDNTAVATVDDSGKVTAKAAGTARITATTKAGNKTASCTINVSPKPGTTYTITWQNDDGTTIKTDQVAYGDTPSYNGETPTKASTAQYSYTFSGWTPSITSVTKDATYKATFTRSTIKYNITWQNDDGSTIKTDQVAYGDTPSYSGPTPTKASTAQYSYTFSGWTPSITSVTKDATYKATFTQSTIKYNITWQNEDGSTIKTDQVAYGDTPSYSGPTPTKASTAQYSYTFSGWTPSITSVTKDATYTAAFTPTVNKYNISFVDSDENVLESGEYEYGTEPSEIKQPIMSAKTEDDNNIYYFTGWTPEITEVKEDVIYHPVYSTEERKYTIEFLDEDGSELKAAMKYSYGTSVDDIQKPDDPVKDDTEQYSYTFAGWNPQLSAVIGDTIYKAVYTKKLKEYTVIWKNEDGSILETDNLPYGSKLSYDGKTPNKAADSTYTYTFIGWSPAFSSDTTVTKDAVYVAQYKKEPIPAPVTEAKKTLTVQAAQTAVVDNSMPVINPDTIKIDVPTNNSTLKIGLGTVNADDCLIEYRQAGESNWKAICYGTGSSCTLSNMKKNGCYEIRITTAKYENGSWKKGRASESSYIWMEKTKVKKIKTGKKQMTVSFKKVKKASGYEISYTTDKSFKKNVKKVTVKGNKKTKRTIKGLKKGKTYYVSVRPYTKKGGKKYTGGSSGSKKAKIKK